MKFSFRVMLLTVLVLLVLCTVVSLGLSSYYTANATASDLTLKVLDQTSLVIDQEVRGLLRFADHLGDLTRRMVQAKALSVDDPKGLLHHFRAVMESSPDLTGVFLGKQNYGECIGLTRLHKNHLIVWELRRNPSTNKLEIREYEPDDYPNKPSRVDLDGDQADSRARPWYIDARQSGRQVWSQVYPFFMFRGDATVPGITCATPLYTDGGDLSGVLAIDIRLDQLCGFLRTLRIGERGFPFVVEIHGDAPRHVIAHPNPSILLRPVSTATGMAGTELMAPEDISDRRIAAFMARVPADEGAASRPESKPVHFIESDVHYLGSYRVLTGDNLPSWLLCAVVPEDEVLARARSNRDLAILLGLGISLAAVLVSLLVSRNLSRSLVHLVGVTQAVGRFQVESAAPVSSVVSEIDQLGRAAEQMKTSLRSFGRYVPTDLVRQLLTSGVEARPGGEDRVLTIFFCDLADFTSTSENLSPQALVEQLGEYFTAFTEEVAATGGTVDKFIGDAVMAFWGAPIEIADHASAACRCALACQRRLAELREKWQVQGKPAFFARIGINTGPVVVGNIGSSRRLNYTVIGDAVNVASRLEGLNKYYGTKICLSQETYRAASEAVLARPMDRVSVKGKSAPILVYELVGLISEASETDKKIIAVHERGLEYYSYREWAKAIASFEEILQLRPEDRPAAEMLRRCRTFELTPPPADWDGVNRMLSK